jgi:hypothetical protein
MKTKLRLMLFAFILLSGIQSTTVSAASWYVKANASGTGASWDDPANISIITSGVADGDVVYVAAGSYLRTTQLSIGKYITVKGGYSATSTGTDISVCDPVANQVIFSPDGSSTTRCMAINATAAPSVPGQKIVLDGLYFNGFAMTTGNGGTALSITTAQANIECKNLTFTNNISLNANGGAINMGSFAYNITISFENCNFTGNQANWTSANGYGGVAYFNNGTTAKTINFTNCNFKNNSAYGRAGALYFTSVITCNITDCVFDTNFSSNTTDNLSTGNGGCFYIAGGTAANTFNLLRTIIVNSSNTSNGSVFWFNTTPKNTLNLTDCSLIGNYSSRTSSARAAVDCSSFATTLGGAITGTVMSNYNWSGGAKASNKADVMNLTGTSTDANLTFSNSILNGVHIASSNALAAVTSPTIYLTTGYLDESTIALALSGNLKITDKIVLKKTFIAADAGSYAPVKIFDTKRLTGKAMTLIATIPSGYLLRVDGTDYTTGSNVEISIPVSGSDPVISLLVDPSTGINNDGDSQIKVLNRNGELVVTGISAGNIVSLYNTAGQLISRKLAVADYLPIQANGLVIVKVNDGVNTRIVKTLIH